MSQWVVEGEPAYLIDLRHYRESSALIRVLTLNHGVVSLVAKGVRGGKKSLAGSLQPCVPLRVSWKGRGDLKTLSTLDATSPLFLHYRLTGIYYYSILYVNELLCRLLREGEAFQDIFATYCVLVDEVSLEKPIDRCLRVFETSLLASLGYGVDLTRDWVSGERVRPGVYYTLSTPNGVSVIPDMSEAPSLYGAMDGTLLLQVANGDYFGEAGRLAKMINRQLIQHYLGEKPLKSRELYKRMKELKGYGNKTLQ